MVESVVPEVMAQVLNSHFITPGEKYVDNDNDLNGVVQNYNEGADSDGIVIELNDPQILAGGTLSYSSTYNSEIVEKILAAIYDREAGEPKSDIKINLVQGKNKIKGIANINTDYEDYFEVYVDGEPLYHFEVYIDSDSDYVQITFAGLRNIEEFNFDDRPVN